MIGGKLIRAMLTARAVGTLSVQSVMKTKHDVIPSETDCPPAILHWCSILHSAQSPSKADSMRAASGTLPSHSRGLVGGSGMQQQQHHGLLSLPLLPNTRAASGFSESSITHVTSMSSILTITLCPRRARAFGSAPTTSPRPPAVHTRATAQAGEGSTHRP